MKAHTAYLFSERGAQRVIAASSGLVYLPQIKRWVSPAGEVVTVREYDRWCDVPRAWVGHLPWWR